MFYDVCYFVPLACSVYFPGKVPEDRLMYCERFVEFLIDIEAQLPTRRFFNALLHDSHVLSISLLSSLNKRDEGKLFSEVGS